MSERYFEPETVAEAVRLIVEEGEEAAVVAGGTDLVVGARSGKRPLAASLVAIHRIGELTGISPDGEGSLRLGALTSHAALAASTLVAERYSALRDAALLVGSPATRHAGTLGGNLCNGSPAMETGSPLLVFEAAVELASPAGTRLVPLEEFLRAPGQTALAAGELLTAVLVPPLPDGRAGSAYQRLEYRQAMEIAIVGAAALLTLDQNGACSEARIALTAVAPTCIRAPQAETILHGKQPTDELLTEAAQLAADAAHPIDDLRASARYRTAMIPVITRRTLTLARDRATHTKR